MCLKRSRWWLRKGQLSLAGVEHRASFSSIFMLCLCRSPSFTLVYASPSLPAHFPRLLSPHCDLLCLHCPLLHNQRSLLLNSGLRQLTFMRLDIPVQPHSYVQWAKGTKATSHTIQPIPHMQGLLRGGWISTSAKNPLWHCRCKLSKFDPFRGVSCVLRWNPTVGTLSSWFYIWWSSDVSSTCSKMWSLMSFGRVFF